MTASASQAAAQTPMPAAGPAKPSLTMKRHFRAPVDKVFAAWTRSETMKKWFGPSDDMPAIVVDLDVRVGGRYHLVLQGKEERHAVSGIYREIVPDTRLVFTWAWESTPERESLVTVEFAPAEGGTMLTLTHAQFVDDDARARHEHGWSGSLERLARLFA